MITSCFILLASLALAGESVYTYGCAGRVRLSRDAASVLQRFGRSPSGSRQAGSAFWRVMRRYSFKRIFLYMLHPHT